MNISGEKKSARSCMAGTQTHTSIALQGVWGGSLTAVCSAICSDGERDLQAGPEHQGRKISSPTFPPTSNNQPTTNTNGLVQAAPIQKRVCVRSQMSPGQNAHHETLELAFTVRTERAFWTGKCWWLEWSVYSTTATTMADGLAASMLLDVHQRKERSKDEVTNAAILPDLMLRMFNSRGGEHFHMLGAENSH